MSSVALEAAEGLDLAERLARDLATALGGRVAGVVLHGSLVLGGYLRGRSDVDLLVIAQGRLDSQELRTMANVVRRHTAAPADIRVVTRAVAARPNRRPAMEAYLRIRPERRPSVELEGIDTRERDLVIELSVSRAHGRSLLGAAAAELIGPVPDEWVLETGLAQLRDWHAIGDDPYYAELTVLTACRLWRFAEEARHCSKEAAGEWALRRRPDLGVIRDALDQRHRDPVRSIDARQVAALLSLVIERVVTAGHSLSRAASRTDGAMS
jgi:predicted nucleotidyltransferase